MFLENSSGIGHRCGDVNAIAVVQRRTKKVFSEMNFKEMIFCFAKGFAMGLADLVPGISGGTVAMLTGIYKRWLYAIGSLKARHFFLCLALFVKVFSPRKRKFYKSYWQCLQEEVDFLFLLLLLGGMLCAILGMSHGIHYLLKTFPFFMKCLFFFLVLIGLFQMLMNMTWNKKSVLCLLVSTLLSSYFFSQVGVMKGLYWNETSLSYVCFSGFLAIGAMLLPGISGSYVLLLMNSYTRVLEMLKNFEWAWLIPFTLSVGLGFLFFSRWIKWLLKKQPLVTFSFLLGLMFGSLQVLWPWS